MARAKEPGPESPPKSFPEVPPSSYAQSVGIGHVVESMMQMQQSIGELKANVDHLTRASDKQSGKLDRISHVIFAAGVVLAIVLSVGGFFMNKIWDGVFTLLVHQHEQQQQLQPQPQHTPNPIAPTK